MKAKTTGKVLTGILGAVAAIGLSAHVAQAASELTVYTAIEADDLKRYPAMPTA